MRLPGRSRDFRPFAFLIFPLRQGLLVALAMMGVLAAALFPSVPHEVRLWYAYIFLATAFLATASLLGALRGALLAIAALASSRADASVEYHAPGFDELVRRLGIRRRVRVFVTSSRLAGSAFTNLLTCNIHVPKSWLGQFPSTSEMAAILGHELVHVKTRRRFILEVLLAMAVVSGLALAVGLRTNPVMMQIFLVAIALLALTYVSWRNEFRADREGARAASPEGLISVLEVWLAQSGRDDGTETHPPLGHRIRRLTRMLNETPIPGEGPR